MAENRAYGYSAEEVTKRKEMLVVRYTAGNGQYAVLLTESHRLTGPIRVQPIDETGAISSYDPFWTKPEGWDYVGKIVFCIAGTRRRPNSRWKRFCALFAAESFTPIQYMTEEFRLAAPEAYLPVAAIIDPPWGFWDRFDSSLE